MKPNYEIIEKYILGDLTSEEKLDFENQMNSDTEFKEEVDLYVELNKSLQNKYSNLEKESLLKQTLENQGAKHFNKSENTLSKNTNFKRTLFRITSIAAIFVIGFFLLKPQTDLYTQFAVHQELSLQEKGSTIINLVRAEKSFNDKDYAKAILLFQSYFKENPEDPEIQMALGISLLEENQIEDAMIIFSQVYGKEDIFKSKAAWYMALSYLKLKDYSQTKAFIWEIDKESIYYPESQKLLKKLK